MIKVQTIGSRHAGVMRLRAMSAPPRSMKEMREIARADVCRRWRKAEARNALALDDDPE